MYSGGGAGGRSPEKGASTCARVRLRPPKTVADPSALIWTARSTQSPILMVGSRRLVTG
jgi:hypothetical protein